MKSISKKSPQKEEQKSQIGRLMLGLSISTLLVGSGSWYIYSSNKQDDKNQSFTSSPSLEKHQSHSHLKTSNLNKRSSHLSCKHHHLTTQKKEVTQIKSVHFSGKKEIISAKVGDQLEISFGDELKILGQVNMNKIVTGDRKAIGMDLVGQDGYLYWLQDPKGSVIGRVVIRNKTENQAFRFKKKNNSWTLEKLAYSDLVCASGPRGQKAGIPRNPKAKKRILKQSKAASSIPILNSDLSAKAVVYLDFDGEKVSGTGWNADNGGKDIIAEPSQLSKEEIRGIWEECAEDMRPFKINVTTDLAVFKKAPINKRMQCIITPTDTVAKGSGGISVLQSFYDGSIDPCWNFNMIVGDGTSSHEVGHTFGLSHDGGPHGEEYCEGNGSWGPIMGAPPETTAVISWSKGDYKGSTSKEDDLAIIAARSAAYRTDDYGNTLTKAHQLTATVDGGEKINLKGIIEKNTDIDVFTFQTLGGNLNLSATSPTKFTNMNILLSLYNEKGKLIVKSEDPGYNAKLSRKLTQGTYYIQIEGIGDGSPDIKGFTDYGSVGSYQLSGTIGGLDQNGIQLSKRQQIASVLGGNFELNVTSPSKKTSWTWSTNASWITSKEPSPQNGSQKFSYTVSKNTTGKKRVGVITFKVANKSFTCTVTQGKNSTFLLSQKTKSFNFYGGSASININSNTKWSWSSNVSWIYSSEPATQIGNQKFSYSVDPNSDGTLRSGVITFRYEGKEAKYMISQSFIQKPNITLEPFTGINVPANPATKGKYTGFLKNATGTNTLGYLKKINVKSNGKFSAKLEMNGFVYSIKGEFDSNGKYSEKVKSKGGKTAQISLQLIKTKGGSYKIKGTFTQKGKTAEIIAVKSGPTTKLAGSYTLLILEAEGTNIPSQGYGHALMKVTSKGVAKIKGLSPDGAKWTGKCLLTKDGEMPLYTSLYKKSGSIAGLIHFRNQKNISDCDGAICWTNNKLKTSNRQRYLIGSYFQPRKGILMSGLNTTDENVKMLTGNPKDLTWEEWDLEWNNKNKINLTFDNSVKLKVAARTGALKGKMLIDDKKWKVKGVFFQKQNIAAGIIQLKGSTPAKFSIIKKN